MGRGMTGPVPLEADPTGLTGLIPASQIFPPVIPDAPQHALGSQPEGTQ
jgi:hypothetical protein